MPLNPIDGTIAAIRMTLRELDFLPESDQLARLKTILRARIAELESFGGANDDAVNDQNTLGAQHIAISPTR